MTFAVGGGPAARPWACASADARSHTQTTEVRMSVDALAGLAAPRLAVGGSSDLDQARVRAVGAARRIGDHLHRISNLERVLVDALPRKLGGRRALDYPLFRRSVVVLHFDVQE